MTVPPRRMWLWLIVSVTLHSHVISFFMNMKQEYYLQRIIAFSTALYYYVQSYPTQFQKYKSCWIILVTPISRNTVITKTLSFVKTFPCISLRHSCNHWDTYLFNSPRPTFLNFSYFFLFFFCFKYKLSWKRNKKKKTLMIMAKCKIYDGLASNLSQQLGEYEQGKGFLSKQAWLQGTRKKNPKTYQWPKFIQLVSIMMLNCHAKMKSKYHATLELFYIKTC